MSAWMFCKDRLEYLATSIIDLLGNGRYYARHERILPILRECEKYSNNNTYEDLYTALADMNAEALLQRYGDKKEDNIEKGQPIKRESLPMIQFLKTLQCYLYQCSEGNVPKTTLFKMLKQLESDLQELIISSMPEYESAQWG